MTPPSHKSSGSVLLMAMLFGFILITVGLGLAYIFMRELKFSSDLLFSERAYFAAESGVEQAVMLLNHESVQYVNESKISFDDGAQTTLTIGNLVKEFSFVVDPGSSSEMFRLRKDQDETLSANIEPVSAWDLKVESADPKTSLPGNVAGWKITCEKSRKTVSLQGKLETGTYNAFQNWSGKYSDGESATSSRSFSNILSDLPDADKTSCVFSAQNILGSGQPSLRFTVTPTNTEVNLSPNKARITAIGTSATRSKTIEFDYAQKNLGALFDFGLLHWGR